MDLSHLNAAELDKLEQALLTAMDGRKFESFAPYPKQWSFFDAGESKRERLLCAGNRLGKTMSAAYEVTCHLTGRYPAVWMGKRLTSPPVGIAAGVTSQLVRDSTQQLLLGTPQNLLGTGFIPADDIVDVSAARGVAGAADLVKVKWHDSNGKHTGESTLYFRAYEQGRERIQALTADFCIAEGERVLMADGRYIPIEQVKPGDFVLTADRNCAPVSRKVIHTWDKGVRDIVEVKATRGPLVRMTPDHAVYQNTKVKTPVSEAKNMLQLLPGWEPERTADRIDAFYAWAGLVVSEGSVSCRKITMGDFATLEQATALLPPEARVRRKDFSEKHNHVPDWFLYWDAFWDDIAPGLAHEKSVPDWVFTSSNAKIAVFLRYLYAGDGWFNNGNVNYASTSRTLANQIVVLLWRLGIRSGVYHKVSKRKAWRDQYHVIITDARASLEFCDVVGTLSKGSAMDATRADAERRMASRATRGWFKGNGLSSPEQLAKASAQNRRKHERTARVSYVEPAGTSRVYDLSIETDHKFVLGTHVVSNCWLDEEPPLDYYMEALTRTNVAFGPVFLTFTPLMGMSDVVKRFLQEKSVDRHVTTMTIHDVLHYSDEQREKIIASYPPHERDARIKGIPMLGSGKIFPIDRESITVDAFPLPDHWPRLCGMDFGWAHATAAVWGAWDRDTDTIYIYDLLKMKETLIPVIAAAIRGRGDWIPVAWPHDGMQVRDGNSGDQLAQQYRKEGVNMRSEHAHFAETPSINETKMSRISTEAGIQEMLTRMMSGRFKVFRHLNDWFEEFDLYHRKDGLIVKIDDDAMSATRILTYDLRHAALPPSQLFKAVDHERRSEWYA